MRTLVAGFVATLLTSAALTVSGLAGCSAGRSEGLDTSKLPDDVRADYAVFALRCSKCHSLARPLNSGIDDDGYWALYVARMRRQPASGITREDAAVILRFLHYYSLEEQRKKGERVPRDLLDGSAPDRGSPPPMSSL